MFSVLASQKLYLNKFHSCMHGFVLAYACNLSDLKLQLLFIKTITLFDLIQLLYAVAMFLVSLMTIKVKTF
jgi:hypothetical protein